MSKSKVITLPAGTVATLWREDNQMCVGLAAPGLPKGVRLSTKASGTVGQELAHYLQELRQAPVIEDLYEAGVEFVNCDADGGVLRWYVNGHSSSLSFIFFSEDNESWTVDISATQTTGINPYLVATLVRSLINTYDEKVSRVVHNDNLIGALVALSYTPKVRLDVDAQQVEKGDMHFKLVQAGADLGFLIGDGAGLTTIDFATECAKALDRPEATIVITDESLREVPEEIDVERYVRAYMARSNSVWASPTETGFTVYAPGGATYVLDADMVVLEVFLDGESVSTDGADRDLLWHVEAVLSGAEGQALLTGDAGEDKLEVWTEKLRSQGVERPREAAKSLIAQGLI